MAGHYSSDEAIFSLFSRPTEPSWRPPQLGALGALLAHWSLPHKTPALVSVPTGAGKTAIAVAAPYLIRAGRTLVVVPSRDLREQSAKAFEAETVLRDIGVRSGDSGPTVVQVAGRPSDWKSLEAADVVVAIPNSISPVYFEDTPPPPDLFDLVIFDEAHHAPAPTWRAILDHFSSARGLLLTATPQRRDGRRVPGDLVYHYPLRQALDDGFYKPVRPRIVDLSVDALRADIDASIVEEVVGLAKRPDHQSSTVLIRASSIDRAKELAERYKDAGLPVEVLSSRMSATSRAELVEQLRGGSVRAVAVVDMLGEGFDLPSLRIAAYHDKHKSVNATIQLIGRLVRSDSRYPQVSLLVAARDIDVYPQLQGVVRSLWEEDADWALVLPGVIDDHIAGSIANQEYARLLPAAPPEVAVEAIQPVIRGILYEVAPDGWEPSFAAGVLPDVLVAGQRIQGQTVMYAACTPTNRTLIVLTTALERPRWHADAGLDSAVYNLHLLTWHPAAQTDQSHLLLVNSSDGAVAKSLLKAIDASERVRLGDPARLQEAFDGLARVSVSNVGVRNTYLGSRGVPSYRTFAGSGVDRGLRDADTAHGALGHAMAQVSDGRRTFTAGVATAKGKFWESRYVPLRQYEEDMTNYATRYWFPPAGGPGRLLPDIARGERLSEFPDDDIAAVELDPALFGMGWTLPSGRGIDLLDLQPDLERGRTAHILPLQAVDPTNPSTPVWRGDLDVMGTFHDLSPILVQRGFGASRSLADILTDRPPNIYYLGGQSVVGSVLYRLRPPAVDLPNLRYESRDWSTVDLTAETYANASAKGASKSIHEALEEWLRARPRRRRHRWILCNDGAGEIADYIVLEVDPGFRITASLWHAKAAGARTASIRVGDMQVVVAQAIKSRRWATDRTLWAELGARLSGRSGPKLTVVEGSETLLRIICGEDKRHPAFSLTTRGPRIDCEVGIAQPGLALQNLRDDLNSATPSRSSQQIRELLTVWHDAVALVGSPVLLSTA